MLLLNGVNSPLLVRYLIILPIPQKERELVRGVMIVYAVLILLFIRISKPRAFMPNQLKTLIILMCIVGASSQNLSN
jgi:hypothetical protein